MEAIGLGTSTFSTKKTLHLFSQISSQTFFFQDYFSISIFICSSSESMNAFFVAQQPKLGIGRLCAEDSRLHTNTYKHIHTHTHTHTHTHSRTPPNNWSVCHRGCYLHETQTRDELPCPQWDSNPRSQQSSDRRTTLQARWDRPWVRIVCRICEWNTESAWPTDGRN